MTVGSGQKTLTSIIVVCHRGNMAKEFDKNVFINCPFDDDYRQLLEALIFVVKFLGYNPRIATERADSSDSRIHKIVDLIKECKFGIHDLSRIISTEEGQPFRMNMPFELGIDYGAKTLADSGRFTTKKLLVLEQKRYRFQKALSDMAGSDIKSHENDPLKLIRAVRAWFLISDGNRSPAPKIIWKKFNYFNAYLASKLEDKGYDVDEVEKIDIPELMMYLDDWLTEDISND